MIQITEQQIAAMAPNAAAINNAKKISQKGKFIKLAASSDETFYMGECEGSGKSNYLTSADYINPAEPVFRCSCPSRQFPCKHSLALLYEIAMGKEFETCEIPEDILAKRARKEAKEEKKAEKKSAPAKVNKAARTKKLKKQMEGLKMTEQVVTDLLNVGLGTIEGNSVKTYKDLAKQLGDYYLPGPQLYIKRFILEIEQLQKNSNSGHYENAVHILVKLRALVKKATAYLTDKIENEKLEDDDSILFEELGGIWQLERLQQIGLKKENARMLQLSFEVYLDEARGEYVDKGYWTDLDTAEVFETYNYRPLKALKHIKQEDSIFEVANIPVLTYYPGELNRRIRWEGVQYQPVTNKDLIQLKEKAIGDIAAAVKIVKNQIKNTLSEDYVALLLRFSKIGKIENRYVLEDATGARILLEDMPGKDRTSTKLELLPTAALFSNQTVLGAFFYEPKTNRICLQPYSIITEEKVIRLQY